MNQTKSHKSNDAIDNVVGHSLLAEVEELPVVQVETRPKKVPKSLRGIGPGGRLPGAFNVRQRATGETPSWIQQENIDNTLESCYDNLSTSLEVGSDSQENDETCIVIAGAELSKPLSAPILIEGTTLNPRCKQLYIFLGFLTAVIVIASMAAMVTSKIAFFAPVSPGLDHDLFQGTLAPTSAPFERQLDWTIADALIRNRVALLTAGHLFFDILNDTDTNFTYFGVVEDATLLGDAHSATLSKYLSSLWNGHVVSAFFMIVLLYWFCCS